LNSIIPKDRVLDIINGDEPTYSEKQILVDQKNIIGERKHQEKIEYWEYSQKIDQLKSDLDKAKKNKNKRRNMRKKLRR